MEGRCKTCKQWMQKFQGAEQWGWCSFADGVVGRARHPQSLAYATDYEGYAAHLETHEDFGCVQWEAKVRAPQSLEVVVQGSSDTSPA
jgi:hypothetical protein